MDLTRWLADRILSDTRAGHRLRRLYRRLHPGSVVEWQHEVIHALDRSIPEIRFVQVGSNDAGYGDPIRYYILHRGWRGLMIEPLPYIFERLTRRYRHLPGLQFANVAISDEPGEAPFYHLRPSNEPGLPPWYDMLGSFDREQVLRHGKYLADIPERIVETRVRCATLDEACVRHGLSRFEFVHIDAEGHDYRVLRTLDLHGRGVQGVLFENRHLGEAEYRDALEYLHAAGFLAHSDQFDTIAVTRDLLRRRTPLSRVWRQLRRWEGADFDAPHSGRREPEYAR